MNYSQLQISLFEYITISICKYQYYKLGCKSIDEFNSYNKVNHTWLNYFKYPFYVSTCTDFSNEIFALLSPMQSVSDSPMSFMAYHISQKETFNYIDFIDSKFTLKSNDFDNNISYLRNLEVLKDANLLSDCKSMRMNICDIVDEAIKVINDQSSNGFFTANSEGLRGCAIWVNVHSISLKNNSVIDISDYNKKGRPYYREIDFQQTRENRINFILNEV